VPTPAAGAPAPEIPLAPTLKAVVGGTAAQQKLEQSENETNRKLYEAALGWGRAVPEEQRKAEATLRNLIGRMGAAGTINSSLNQEGQTLIRTEEDAAIQKALDIYYKAVREANDFMQTARDVYNQAIEERHREEAEQAVKNLPKAAGPETPEMAAASARWPAATARVLEAFPGGEAEHKAWIKAHSHYVR